MRAWFAACWILFCLASSALAENRLALVIGNDSYKHIDVLQKAKADAQAYAQLLRDKGFKVQEGYDLGFLDLQGAVAQFVEKIQPGDTVVFVYAGHGWSDGSTNYVVGVDAPSSSTQEFLTRVSLPIRNGANGVLDDLTRKGAALKVAIIDACRDNPFHPPEGQRGYGLTRGLRPASVAGSFVIYSAGDNQSALDRLSEADKDPNSVFTRTLVPALRADLPLIDAIKASQENTHALAASVDHEQTPAYYDEVLGRACLSRECMTASPAAPTAPAPAASDAALSSLIDGAASADFLATLSAGLPDGPLKERAKARMAERKKTQLANLSVVPLNPPSPPSSNHAGRVDGGEPHFAAIWVKPGGSDFVARHGLSAQEYQQQFDDTVVYVLGSDGKLWREFGTYDNSSRPRVMVDANVKGFQAIDDTLVYVLGSDGKLWREFGTYDNSSRPRVMVDANVKGFQAIDDTLVYVLGSDGKLWREFGTYDNSSRPRVMVDANVKGFQAIDDTLVYVLGSDGKLWREFGTYDNSSRPRVMVDANVQGFQAIDDTLVYVLGSDGKLWREFGTYDNSSRPRVMVDANVQGFQAIDDTLVYVLGSDGKLWREFGTYDNSSRPRVMVDANVQGFQAIDDRRDRFAP